MNEFGDSETISDEHFEQACSAFGISDRLTDILICVLSEPEYKMEMLRWLILSGEQDEEKMFRKAGEIIGVTDD